MRKITIATQLISAALLAMPCANAGTFSADAGLETSYSSNVNRSAVDREESSITTANVGVEYEKTPGRLNALLNFDVQQRQFSQEFDDESEVNLVLDADYELVENRLLWELVDELESIVTDTSGQDTPDNREQRNFFSTGPRLTLPLGQRNTLSLSGRYQKTSFEDTEADNDGVAASAIAARQLTAATQLIIDYRYTFTDFEGDAEVVRNSVGGGFDTKLNRLELSARAGFQTSTTDQDAIESTTEAPSWDLSATWNATDTSAFFVTYQQSLTDVGQSFSIFDGANGFNFNDSFVVTIESARGGFRTQVSPKLFTETSISYFDEEFEDEPIVGGVDEGAEDSLRWESSWTYQAKTEWDIRFSVSYEERDFDEPAREDEAWFFRLVNNYDITPRLAITLNLAWTEETSTDDLEEFEEFEGGIGINYQIFQGGRR